MNSNRFKKENFDVVLSYDDLYSVFMIPASAHAEFSRPDTMLATGKIYYFYEDHIGRPVYISEYEDYNTDGSYYKGDGNSAPYFQATYTPFGAVAEDFDSTGITIGDPNTTGITWSVPFRFPGQFQDPVSYLYNELYYNWNRYYMPSVGRYTQADPFFYFSSQSLYLYSQNNPITASDPSGLFYTIANPGNMGSALGLSLKDALFPSCTTREECGKLYNNELNECYYRVALSQLASLGALVATGGGYGEAKAIMSMGFRLFMKLTLIQRIKSCEENAHEYYMRCLAEAP